MIYGTTRSQQHCITNNHGRKFYVDGFSPSRNEIFEFNGDMHHGNPIRYEHCFDKPVWKTSTKTFRDMYAKHEERYIMLISMGYRVTTCGNLIGGN